MDFLTTCRNTQNELKKLETLINELDRKIKTKSTSVLSPQEESKLNNLIDVSTSTINSMIMNLKSRILMMQDETKEMESKNTNSHIIDMRKTHIRNLFAKLQAFVKAFQNTQILLREKEKSRMQETYLVAVPDATEEELEALNDPDKAAELLENAFATGSNSTKSILTTARQRKKGIDSLYEKITRLVSLMEEIDRIVSENDDCVDTLLITVTKTNKNTEEAVNQLQQARDYQDRVNWLKKIVASIFVIFALLFIVLVIKPMFS